MFRPVRQVAAPGAKYAVSDCILLLLIIAMILSVIIIIIIITVPVSNIISDIA